MCKLYLFIDGALILLATIDSSIQRQHHREGREQREQIPPPHESGKGKIRRLWVLSCVGVVKISFSGKEVHDLRGLLWGQLQEALPQ